MKLFYQIILILFLACAINAQSVDKISRQCKPPNKSLFSTVLVEGAGDISSTPCPTRSNILTTPVRVHDRNFGNFQGHDTLLSLGSVTPIPYSSALVGAHAVEVDTTFIGASAPAIGINVRSNGITTSGASGWAPETIGIFSLATNLGEPNIARSIIGVHGVSYLRSPQAALAIGGKFESYSGGNSGVTNLTPMYGIQASVFGGHNGTSPLTVAGDFNVSNLGGGGVGNITEGIAVRARFDGGSPTTNYIAAKGIALQGWGAAAGGGAYANSYGIYADTSIDRGAVSRYFIYSLSTSPSLFSGLVRVETNDVYISDSARGIILKSPDATCYRFTVANGGALNAGVVIACP